MSYVKRKRDNEQGYEQAALDLSYEVFEETMYIRDKPKDYKTAPVKPGYPLYSKKEAKKRALEQFSKRWKNLATDPTKWDAAFSAKWKDLAEES